MKPAKKNLFFLVLFISTLYSTIASFGQCSSPKSITYNVRLSGTGNDLWSFQFPRFNPIKGTLGAVVITSVVSLNYNFVLQNNDASNVTYNLAIQRNDNITNNDMASPVINTVTNNFGPYNLSSGESVVGAGTNASPQYFPVLSAYNIKDSIVNNVIGFLGTGYTLFNYSPSTNSIISGGTNYNFSNLVSDTMDISLTYYYCDATALAEDIVSFSATKADDNTVNLNWQAVNEPIGRVYNIEESSDGINFNYVASESFSGNNSVNNYLYKYSVVGSKPGKIYFRLRESGEKGTTGYSDIKFIDFQNDPVSISLYPNPANKFINVSLNNVAEANWQADIFSANGQIVQTNSFGKCTSAKIIFKNVLPKGAYFIKLTNKENYTTKTLSFIIL
jgi:hypothetical protein